jgi:hypothetical protein
VEEMTKEEREEGKQRFGQIKSVAFAPETAKGRLDVVHLAIGMLIKDFDPDKMIMDIDTLQFIIHRKPETDGLTIAMKYEGWWNDNG